jgi:hypothetical protein
MPGGGVMKHIAKQDWMGCAIASTAMLANLTFEEVAARPRLGDFAHTRYPEGLCALLAAATGSEWRITSFWFRPMLADFCFPAWAVAVFLENAPDQRLRLGQWIVVNREIVHDPEMRTACTVRNYPRRNWRIASLAQPRRPIKFAAEQARRRLDQVCQELQREMATLAKP